METVFVGMGLAAGRAWDLDHPGAFVRRASSASPRVVRAISSTPVGRRLTVVTVERPVFARA